MVSVRAARLRKVTRVAKRSSRGRCSSRDGRAVEVKAQHKNTKKVKNINYEKKSLGVKLSV